LFKIFPAHLTEPQRAQVIANANAVIILRRNLLHSFISDQIATESGAYSNKDSSDCKIEFKPNMFVTWAGRVSAFLQRSVQQANDYGVEVIELFYEDFVQQPGLQLMPVLNKLGLSVGGEFNANNTGMKKQDSRISAFEKVLNESCMQQCLESVGFTGLIDASTTMKGLETRCI
jgi:hypothetical protein